LIIHQAPRPMKNPRRVDFSFPALNIQLTCPILHLCLGARESNVLGNLDQLG
jgi:hypothetical protein